MMRDYLERFGQDQAVTSTTVQSTNNYDTRNVVDRGDDTMMVEFYVTEAFAGGTSLSLNIMNAAAADRTGEASISALSVPLASLTLGAKFHLQIPKKTLRYLSASYIPTGTFTAGKISSGMIVKEQTNGNVAMDEFYSIDNSGR